ncbi:hypothetical protein EVAR_49053_1 [Eumeta japonica]|uniref:Uncharacterized protein n=1 Tax=Eumeta variegata TaxID=151549 RepID=A0A4C1Y3V1_EUMVA|nr:hypothetical protein EVAR_49053_1 [Eumeta japonica]
MPLRLHDGKTSLDHFPLLSISPLRPSSDILCIHKRIRIGMYEIVQSSRDNVISCLEASRLKQAQKQVPVERYYDLIVKFEVRGSAVKGNRMSVKRPPLICVQNDVGVAHFFENREWNTRVVNSTSDVGLSGMRSGTGPGLGIMVDDVIGRHKKKAKEFVVKSRISIDIPERTGNFQRICKGLQLRFCGGLFVSGARLSGHARDPNATAFAYCVE